MICPRRNHHLILFYCLFVLVHFRQTVNSLQNEYHRHPESTHHRYGHNPLPPRYPKWSSSEVVDFKRNEPAMNGIRGIEEPEHHLRHQHNRALPGHQHPSSGLNSLRNEGLYRSNPSASSSSSPQRSSYRSSNRRIEEAAHAFQAATTAHPTGSYGHYPHRFNQLPHNHRSAHHSLHRPTQHSINPQTPRPRPDGDSLESHRKWAGSHHQGSGVMNDFTTGSPSIERMDPSQRLSHTGRSSVSVKSQHNQRHDASEDDDEYYYYEDDNDNDDDDKNDGDNGHANEYVDNSEYMVIDAMSRKRRTEGFATDDSSSSLRHANTRRYHDENSLQADEPSYDSGSFTEQKWQNYSTREGVGKMAAAENPMLAANEHLKRVRIEGKCEYPKLKVIPLPTSTSKLFFPHCTMLHRCGDDTGCCMSDTQSCVAKSTASVELYFKVQHLGRSIYEPLSLINHTECHCVNRSQLPTTTESPVYYTVTSPKYHTKGCVTYFDLDESEPNDVRCVCKTGNHEVGPICMRLSKGEEGFLVEDQRCVHQGRCLSPTCMYGQYNRAKGRCPNKDHLFSIAKNINQTFH